MRLFLVATLLVALVPHAAAKSPFEVPTIDVTDAHGDARAYPDVRLAQSDIARFTSRLEGDMVVQKVEVVGPWPGNDYWTEVRVGFGTGESVTLKVERTNSSGSNPHPTDYNTSLVQSKDAARAGKHVDFTFERDDTSLTFRWPVSTIPDSATCFQPHVTTLSRTMVDGRSTQVDDELDLSPNLCATNDVREDGIDGTCPAPASRRVKAASVDDARDDVGKRDNLDLVPHKNATLDVLSFDQRLDNGWVVQTVKLAEASPRDQVEISTEAQYRVNKSQFERGARVLVSLMGTSASGSLIGENRTPSFHVRAERVEPAGWELRWCASVVPADAECFQLVAKATLGKDYVDATPLAGEACPEPDDEDAKDDDNGAAPTGGGPDAPEGGSEPEKGAPGFAPAALVGAILVALALRRRG
ncbi:MAG TPA: hypothetical protein VM370_11885 [Candidatus Thermoplasmatota archaeon]|nr:hypothetical protein [Candidatus Thermoplasmatota archaeon]